MENNFNFLVGEWTSKQRRLREVLKGSDDWYEFDGYTKSWSAFDGAANIDEVRFPSEGFAGLTLRLHDKDSDTWSIYWVNSRTGTLGLPPVVGRFDENGVGVFTSEEDYEGIPIVCRYKWIRVGPDEARWEQAFSTDGGDTWETNWVAEFSRSVGSDG